MLPGGAGWSDSDADATEATWQPGDEIQNVTQSYTLYAVWRRNPALTYDANGGSFSVYVGTEYPAYGTEHTLTTVTPVREGYDFVGWAESAAEADGETVYSAGVPIV